MEAGEFTISVIIPVKNGAETLERCLKSIRQQTVANKLEIIILDSGSTDQSSSIALLYDAKVVPVEPASFNHGLTRNEGIKYAKGNLVFYTVQDAWLSEKNLIEKMTLHFFDSAVKGVVGHQAVPHEKETNPMLWFKRISEPQIEIRYKKGIKDPMPQYSWDNVAALYKKEALHELPFEKTDTGEDWIWAFAALQRGWKLVYDPSIVIYHYHHRTFQYVFRSEYSTYYTFYKWFKQSPEWPSWFRKNASMFYHLSKNSQLQLKEKIYWIGHNLISNTAHWVTVCFFRTVLMFSGEKGTEKYYRIFCYNIPQGKQKRKL